MNGKQTKDPKVSVTCQLDRSVIDWLDQLAMDEKRSRSFLVNELLTSIMTGQLQVVENA